MMMLYGLGRDTAFAQALANHVGAPLATHEMRDFEDGECKLRPTTDPRGADAYVIYSLHADQWHSPHDKLCQLLMLIATLVDHGAARVSAVTPYFAYARKDRRTKPFDPLTLRYVAQLLEAVGTYQVFALEVHNPAAFQNAFRIPTVHLSVHGAFDRVVLDLATDGALSVASPDPGGVKRVQLWRESLEAILERPVSFAMVDKRRSAGLLNSENLVAGDVAGRTVMVLDDLISSGDTMRRAAKALCREGARKVLVFAAHGLFTGSAAETLADEHIAKLVVSDSVPAFRLSAQAAVRPKLVVASAVPMVAEAITASYRAWQG